LIVRITFIHVSCEREIIPEINALKNNSLTKLQAYLDSNVAGYQDCDENC